MMHIEKKWCTKRCVSLLVKVSVFAFQTLKYLKEAQMKQYCKEKATEGEMKLPVSFLVLCFWPQSVVTSCLFMSLTSLISLKGPMLGDASEGR